MNHLLLDCLALGAILSGVLVITSKNPVISVLFLISVFVNVAGYLVLLGVGFIGISYLIVYVGAVAILFLFVVMMLNLQLAELSAVGSEYTQSLPLGAIVGSLFIFELGSVLPFSYKDVGTFLVGTEGIPSLLPNLHLGLFNWFNTTFLGVEDTTLNVDVQLAFNGGVPDDHVASFLQIQSIGHMLYTTGTVWLMLASIILMLAMTGPISLSMDKQVVLTPLSIL